MASLPSLCEATLMNVPQPVLVGVSGGIDSMALLHALIKVGRKPVVVHFDHGWRTESGQDAAWVKKQATRLGLECVIGRPQARAEPKRETTARTSRYFFFHKTAEKLGIFDLILAHQADDQVETFLMQLLRGSGAAARGMDRIGHRPNLVLHRPWLGLWRKDILAYARREKLTWREDATNLDTKHRRNLIRRRVLPYLEEQISKQVSENLWRTAEILRAESEWLDTLCAREATQKRLEVKVLHEEPVAQQRRTILRWLQQHAVRDVSFVDVESVRNLIQKESPAKINLSEGRFVRRRSGKIFLEV